MPVVPPQLSLLVGRIPQGDNLGQFEPNLRAGGIFTDYMIQSYYEADQHVYMIPLAGTLPAPVRGESVLSTQPRAQPFPGSDTLTSTQQRPSTAFVQLAAPTLLWIVDWTAQRLGSPPITPSPEPEDPNWVLLDEHYNPTMITVAVDGRTPLYRLTGTFVYGHRHATDTVNHLRFPRPPWLQDTFVRRYDPELQTGRLIDEP